MIPLTFGGLVGKGLGKAREFRMQHGNDANGTIREGEPPLIRASRDSSLQDCGRARTGLIRFFAIMAITCCTILGGSIAYLAHPWWFRGGSSFAVINDFIGGIAVGGI